MMLVIVPVFAALYVGELAWGLAAWLGRRLLRVGQ